MAKNFFQDMIKMKSDLRKEMADKVESQVQKTPVQVTEKVIERPPVVEQGDWTPVVSNKVTRRVDLFPEEKSRKPRHSIWLVALVSVVFLFFAVSFFFSEASITINPKIKEASFNETISASKRESGGAGLPFDIVVLSGEESKTVEGGEVKDASISARGTVIIYNDYSATSQRLDIDTRLEGSNGKLYKTEKQITVPGKKGSTPGSVEVGIYAAVAGEEYNSKPLDFQIFGFKGTPKYSKFYARSKGDITGGMVGKVSFIAEEQKNSIVNELKETLQARLLKKATDLTPEGFILFKDSIVLNIDEANFDAGEGTQVPVKIKGTFFGFLFDEKELIKKIAEDTVADYDGSDVFISNIHDLNFTFIGKDSASLGDVKNLSFSLSGSPKVVWRLDQEKLLTDIAGKSKKDFYEVLAGYANVESADVTLRPLWKRSFPDDTKSIQIMVNYPE